VLSVSYMAELDPASSRNLKWKFVGKTTYSSSPGLISVNALDWIPLPFSMSCNRLVSLDGLEDFLSLTGEKKLYRVLTKAGHKKSNCMCRLIKIAAMYCNFCQPDGEFPVLYFLPHLINHWTGVCYSQEFPVYVCIHSLHTCVCTLDLYRLRQGFSIKPLSCTYTCLLWRICKGWAWFWLHPCGSGCRKRELWKKEANPDEWRPGKLNRDVALRALWPKSLFLGLFSVNSCPKITHLFW
jgi:hypothetical protein